MKLKAVKESGPNVFEIIEFVPTMKNTEIESKILDNAIILRPVGVEDADDVDLYESDIVEFDYVCNGCESTLLGELVYEGCLWLIVCEDTEDGYVELRDYLENDGRYSWVNIKKIRSKYEVLTK